MGNIVGDAARELTGADYRALSATERTWLVRRESLREIGSHWRVLNGGVM